jgi:DMSO/TMAO reductase YedYZ heme-binding membrane subunit
MKTDPTYWILARAAGLTAYALLTCSALFGLVLRSRPFGKRVKAPTMLDVHRFTALLALSALVAHGVGLLYDTTIHIDLAALLVPGRIPYRPVWTGVGVVTAELTVVIAASFRFRKRIGMKNWRRLHWLTYGLFAGATVHGLLSGSDSNKPWVQLVYLVAIGAVALATTWRVLTVRKPGSKHSGPLAAARLDHVAARG